jgi:hypothetical protein
VTIARQNLFNNALRVILVCTAVAVTYYLWAGQPTVFRAIIIGVACVIIARLAIRAKLAPNPLGEGERDYSVQPVIWGILKGGVCFLAAFVWGIGCVLAVRYLLLPDTKLVQYGLMGIPFVILILAGAWFVIGSGVKAVYGRPKP